MTTVLVFSMSASADGYTADSAGGFAWGAPSPERFRAHLDEVRGVGVHLLGRRLYETMRVWETDPSLRTDDDTAAFADVWAALPKVVFSRTLTEVHGNARLATGSVEDEVAAALRATDREVAVGGPTLAAAAIELVDEFRVFRAPIVVGGGTPYFPPGAALRLETVGTRTFPEGVVLERWRRVRD